MTINIISKADEALLRIVCAQWFFSQIGPVPGLNPALRDSKYAFAFRPTAVSIGSDKIKITRDLETGTKIRFSSTGTLPAPLDDETDYYVINKDATHIRLAASEAEAEPITFTPSDVEGNTITVTREIITDTPIRFNTSDTLPEPLVANRRYLAIRIDATHIQVKSSMAGEIIVLATTGIGTHSLETAIDLTSVGTGIHTLQLEIPAGYGSGTAEDPWRIRTYADLLTWTAEADVLTGYAELCADIDATDSNLLDSGAGWITVGYAGHPFTGHFDGNGHTISNLFIDRNGFDMQGFFGATDSAVISNLGLTDVDMTVYDGNLVSALCGYNVQLATITNCYSTGTIRVKGHSVGGLVGRNDGGSLINHCYSSCSVLGYDDVGNEFNLYYSGGLVGLNNEAEIENSYAIGSVKGATAAGGIVGHNVGLAAMSYIKNCYATGEVSGLRNIGGLVGLNEYSKVYNSFSTGQVNGEGTEFPAAGIGGFVGWNRGLAVITNCYSSSIVNSSMQMGGVGGFAGGNGEYGFPATIRNCFATGAVTGNSLLGGLCGVNEEGEIIRCYATGAVTGATEAPNGLYIGGLVGLHCFGASIRNSYATGSVTGNDSVGGFVGQNLGEDTLIQNCYSIGQVTGNTNVGGFCGYRTDATITSCYYNSQTSGQSDNDGRGVPKTTEELKKKATFVDWDFKWTWRNTEIWEIPFDTGTTKPVIGEILNRVGAAADTCFVLSYTKTSGQWATGDATGNIKVYRCSDSFITNFGSGDDLENAVNQLICNSTGAKSLDIVNSTYPTLFAGLRVVTKDV